MTESSQTQKERDSQSPLFLIIALTNIFAVCFKLLYDFFIFWSMDKTIWAKNNSAALIATKRSLHHGLNVEKERLRDLFRIVIKIS